MNSLPDGTVVHLNMASQRRRMCSWCGRKPVTRLCDFPVGKDKTCDMGICDFCATPVAADQDHCPKHKSHSVQPVQANLFGGAR